MAKQGRMLETMAINELDHRRKRLEEYQIKARFALAESYDRATKAQQDAEFGKQTQNQQTEENKKQAGSQQEPVKQEDAVQEQPQGDSPAEDDAEESQSSFKKKLLKQ